MRLLKIAAHLLAAAYPAGRYWPINSLAACLADDQPLPAGARSASWQSFPMDAPILCFDRYNRPAEQSPQGNCVVWLEITRGRVRQPIRPVNRPVFLIGTAPDCDLVVGDQAFPETYAYLLVQNEHVTIRRVGDGPELLVNDAAVDAVELEDGDRLTLGAFELTLNIQKPTTPVEFSPCELSRGSWWWPANLEEV